jgi:hypothetical protein
MSSSRPISPALSILSVSLYYLMTLVQNSISLPDLGISSSSPNYNTISTERLTPSIHTGSKPNLADEYPYPTIASPYASHPTDASPDLAVPGAVSSSTYL